MIHKNRSYPRPKRTAKSPVTKASAQKVLSFKAVVDLAKAQRKAGQTLVTTNGCFDLLHVGHIHTLEFAKGLGDVLIVGINSDASVQRLKGPTRPVVGEKERAHILAALSAVDAVFIFKGADPISWIKTLRPDIHVKGSDRNLRQIVEKKAVEAVGGKIVLAPIVRGKSTTNEIKKIRTA